MEGLHQTPVGRPGVPAGRMPVVAKLCLLVIAVAVLAQVALYVFVPPYTWRGWVDRERRTVVARRPALPEENAFDCYREMVPLLPAGESEEVAARGSGDSRGIRRPAEWSPRSARSSRITSVPSVCYTRGLADGA